MADGHKTNSDCWEWNIMEHKYMNGTALGNIVWVEKIMIKILGFSHLATKEDRTEEQRKMKSHYKEEQVEKASALCLERANTGST